MDVFVMDEKIKMPRVQNAQGRIRGRLLVLWYMLHRMPQAGYRHYIPGNVLVVFSPKEWWPELSKPYEERYLWRFPGEQLSPTQ
jgi:hypothetical protein